MNLSIAEALQVPSPTLIELALDTHEVDASELVAGAFAVAVYFDQLYPGDSKPDNVALGLASIAHEVLNVVLEPQSDFAKKELWAELNFHTRYNGLNMTLIET